MTQSRIDLALDLADCSPRSASDNLVAHALATELLGGGLQRVAYALANVLLRMVDEEQAPPRASSFDVVAAREATHPTPASPPSEDNHGMASCGHGYAPYSLHCPRCHSTPENIDYLINQGQATRDEVRERHHQIT